MTAIAQNNLLSSIKDEVENHPSWLGHISGLRAEKLLRNKKQPYLYVLRAGECHGEWESDYYITFIDSDLTIRHQPFILTVAPEGWFFENGCGGGPFKNSTSIEEVLHLIMHCEKGACTPLINFQTTRHI